MKRKIAIYVVLIGVLIGSAPYLTGMLAEKKFYDVISLVSEMETLPVKTSVVEYHRGWRKSIAKTQSTIYSDRGTYLKEYHLVLNHEIRHGPFVQLQDGNWKLWEFAKAVVYSTLDLSDEATKVLQQEVGQTDILKLQSIFATNGLVDIMVRSPQLKLKEHEGTDRTAFKGMSGEWLISADMKEIKGSMLLPGVDIDVEGMQLFIDNLSYRTSLKKSVEELWPGSFEAKIDNLKLTLPDKQFTLGLQGLNTQGSMDVKGVTTDFYGNCRINYLSIKDKVYGPIDYNNALLQIDTKLLKSFLTLNHQLETGGGLGAKNKMLQFWMTRLPDFLATRPQFTIDKFYVRTQEGDVNGYFHIEAGGPKANNLTNMAQVLQSIVAKASLSVPKVLLKEFLMQEYVNKQPPQDALPATAPDKEALTYQTLAKWVQEGMLIEKDQYYTTLLEFKNGKFVVNGREVDQPIPGELRVIQ